MRSGDCERCSTYRQWLHKHHKVLQADGGTDADGIEWICANCHEDVHGGPYGGLDRGRTANSPEARAKRSKTMRRKWEHDESFQEKMRNRRHRGSRRPDRDVLERMYHAQGLSQKQIAEQFGVAQANVSMWMADLNIPTRGRSESKMKARPSAEELSQMFETMSARMIGDQYGVSYTTVLNWRKRDVMAVAS